MKEVDVVNKARMVDLLYKRAHGESLNATHDELQALKKYKVYQDDGSFYTTKKNIGDYVSAVDTGKTKVSFYDWCMNNCRADRRRKGSSEKDIADYNSSVSIGSELVGIFFWGLALFWIFEQELNLFGCAVLGAILTVILRKISTRWSVMTCMIVPVVIMACKFV